MNSHKIHLKSIRRLIIALSVSGILNILLITAIFYWMVKDTPPSAYFEQKPALKIEQQVPLASESGNVEWIQYLRTLSFDQLVAKLSNQQLVENGYAQRDLALACLAAFHHFDLPRALVGLTQPEQQRSIVYGHMKDGKPASLIVYPGLSDAQYRAISDFAATERWPLTSKGLFWKIKKSRGNAETSLLDAFVMTPEFLAVEMLFNRVEQPTPKSEIMQMLLEGTWAMLFEFYTQQKVSQDLSPARRQHFLLDYVDHKSKKAAYLMLKVEGDFALKKLDDKHVQQLLSLMNEKTPESEKYAMDLLTSPRSDIVWKNAAAKLFQYAGEAVPEKNLHHHAMTRFMPGEGLIQLPLEKPTTQKMVPKPVQAKPVSQKKSSAKVVVAPKTTSKPVPKKDRLYIVQEGDTLWKISRRFNVGMDDLRNHNKLQKDALQPGTPLRIPN
jgi:hypothetical protein